MERRLFRYEKWELLCHIDSEELLFDDVGCTIGERENHLDDSEGSRRRVRLAR